MKLFTILLFSFFFAATHTLRYQDDQLAWNLNQNKTATKPVDYWGQWENHTFHPSPKSWRFPFYTITLDRYVDGDPTNNDANNTVFEHDWMSNQFRAGGDTRGLMNDLDYIQGMGIKALYLAGSPFINMPWSSDGYGPLDFTLLDHHHGIIEDWRELISEIHRRGMYVLLENTLATMGDLIGFQSFMNASAPFTWDEYDYSWKSSRQYHDFSPGNGQNTSCAYPRFWAETGYLVENDILEHENGCKDSEFDQYGDMKGVGSYPSWQSQLSKFASVQDRLRIWRQDVLDKLNVMSCMQIAMFDIDGFRMDKGLQTPVDAQAQFAVYQRDCARKHGKENFFIAGEVVGEIPLAAVYMGRGKQPDMWIQNITEAQLAGADSSAANQSAYIREFGASALDAAAFHYPTYGAMTRFLGLSGPIGFEGVDWVDHWTKLMQTDDMVNANTGEFDPRHMFGMTNQDVFRWPSLANGIQKQLLGLAVTTLVMPGIPMILWGEEQGFYVLENLASDYVFGRAPMVSQSAWQLHGCYRLGEEVYFELDFNSSAYGCQDDSVSLDHRDPSHPLRNVLKRMYQLRQEYPVFNDGYTLQTLSSQTRDIYLNGSGNIPSPLGMWSVYRGRTVGVQDFSVAGGQGNQGIWLVYMNENETTDYTFDCSNKSTSLISAFPAGSKVRNLLFPYEEYELQESTVRYNIEGSQELNGCLPRLSMSPWGYKAFVPVEKWQTPMPTITRVIPGHDARLESLVPFGQPQNLTIEVRFSSNMSCESVTRGFSIESVTQHGFSPRLDTSSVHCQSKDDDHFIHSSEVPTAWIWTGTLTDVTDGIHRYSINNVSTIDEALFTNARDRFMFRLGQTDNPMVFPLSSNYTTNFLHKDELSSDLYISPKASGADKFRYSTNWGATYSDWIDYDGKNVTLKAQDWFGTHAQSWTGKHVVVNYWSQITGSANHVQHADLNSDLPRRWPHIFVEGEWNEYGYDGGLNNKMRQSTASNGLWKFDLSAEWPTQVVLNVWGMNPDGSPDKSAAFGDVDGDHVLDWLPPDSLATNMINVTALPPKGFTSFKFIVNDGNYHYQIEPVGSRPIQLAVAVLICILPIISGLIAALMFRASFYKVEFNGIGISEKSGLIDSLVNSGFSTWSKHKMNSTSNTTAIEQQPSTSITPSVGNPNHTRRVLNKSSARRTVLIATMEYDIDDWNIKVKIGGLGVMASLMGKSLDYQDLIWVVPCVGGIYYPADQPTEPMVVSILGNTYEIAVQLHKLRNITFVLLDAPVFRKQTQKEPYPARMDDLDSAIFYSAWNACIAEAIKRFPIDLYHINDYHGALAPLHLLPRTIPVCLSLHNAEFQGLWSLRTTRETEEICKTFNLSRGVVERYVQFGEVFNLLHAGASYLRIHQNGFGAVGVSKKYGKRSYARYAIFWGLSGIGALPNPDPSDVTESTKNLPKLNVNEIDEELEASRGTLRVQAQEWASLDRNPDAELFVFVGRWSMQKGVDLIADIFPSILEEYPNAQLMCIGPVIDLYGRFAALKLEKLMEKYPGRVFSKPEFTALPPYIFSGAEFALIPSRDEPFGLVAVEFGRKGALGVGARVGGLGQMPGWWYTIESTSTNHLLRQFGHAIKDALASTEKLRSYMRTRSAQQRFPVAEWVQKLEILQSTSIDMHRRQAEKSLGLLRKSHGSMFKLPDGSKTTPEHISHTTSVTTSRSNSLERNENEARNYDRQNSNWLPWPTSNIPATPMPSYGSRITPVSTVLESDESTSGSDDRLGSQSGQIPAAFILPPQLPNFRVRGPRSSLLASHSHRDGRDMDSGLASATTSRSTTPTAVGSVTPTSNDGVDQPRLNTSRSLLSLTSVRGDGEQKSLGLQKVDLFFTDSENFYYNQFDHKLSSLDVKNSEKDLCIGSYLVRSEKEWFGRYARAKLGRPVSPEPRTGFNLRLSNDCPSERSSLRASGRQSPFSNELDEFLLGGDYNSPKGLQNLLSRKWGDWPFYAYLLALGQIIAANSYQVTLLAGSNGQAATKLYVVANIYLAASIGWWLLYRYVKSIYALSLPFLFYGFAFFFLGFGPYVTNFGGRGWLYNVATALYAIASASGSVFFALNFGDEGGAPVSSWLYRACVIQGIQQIYVALLWYWGDSLTRLSDSGVLWSSYFSSSRYVIAVTTPVAIILWIVGLTLFMGLPDYYRQRPGKIPSFYTSLYHRRTVLCFFFMVVVQNYFLSAPYGRNWRYLWSSQHAPAWAIVILLVTFFIVVWAALLAVINSASLRHSWTMPIFAIGLGLPRWCQMLWGVSGMAAYVPWGGPVVGALLGRSIWLWLGVLDALQGVGFGMILLQTLIRPHILGTLIGAQIIGSVATILARAAGPDSTGPGTVFPNFVLEGLVGISHPWFWVAIVFQVVVCLAFLVFFRREQLFKP